MRRTAAFFSLVFFKLYIFYIVIIFFKCIDNNDKMVVRKNAGKFVQFRGSIGVEHDRTRRRISRFSSASGFQTPLHNGRLRTLHAVLTKFISLQKQTHFRRAHGLSTVRTSENQKPEMEHDASAKKKNGHPAEEEECLKPFF